MSVFINGVEIQGYYIEVFKGYIGGLLLSGKALEEEGKKIHEELKGYKKGDIVQIRDDLYGKYSGVWEIAEIILHVNAQKAPAIYEFRIGFKPK